MYILIVHVRVCTSWCPVYSSKSPQPDGKWQVMTEALIEYLVSVLVMTLIIPHWWVLIGIFCGRETE